MHWLRRVEVREAVARGIRQDAFPADTVESACVKRGKIIEDGLRPSERGRARRCMCKFVATGFGADAVAATRKVLGARALQGWHNDEKYLGLK